ncbi:30S ribosomal protein S21 [Escherichia coli]|uniref:30S ribosomal protein S21 n=1 Tax=Escherichia coli TaxID=562 RepID=UPI000E20D7C2|nr:30S ribosomal protein S21 [Escherichia coli]
MKHEKNTGREFGKRGLTVEVKTIHGEHDGARDARSKALDQALRTLKRRLVQEGVIRDMRRKE